MLDSNLVLLASGATTATRTGSWIDLGKGGLAGNDLAIRVKTSLASPTGTTPSLTPKFDFSDDNGSTIAETQTEPASSTQLVRTYSVDGRWRYIRVTLTVSGTTPDFGNSEVVASTGMVGREFNIANS